MNNRDCTLGFLMGISTGIALGVLFAPKSGIATRNLLTNRMQSAADEVKNQANDVMNSAAGVVEKGRTEMARTKESIKTAIDAGTKAYQAAVHA